MTIAPGVKAQNAKPEFLKGPTTWEFERFALPPGFSQSFPYKGVEELRFSPDMFTKDSVSYFSYAFVARLDNRLNAEVKVISDPKTQTTYLVYIASPQPKSHSIWQELYQIQKDFSVISTAGPR